MTPPTSESGPSTSGAGSHVEDDSDEMPPRKKVCGIFSSDKLKHDYMACNSL